MAAGAVKSLEVDQSKCCIGPRNLAKEMKSEFGRAIKASPNELKSKEEVIQCIMSFLQTDPQAQAKVKLIKAHLADDLFKTNIIKSLTNSLNACKTSVGNNLNFYETDTCRILGIQASSGSGASRETLEKISRVGPQCTKIIRDISAVDLKPYIGQWFVIAEPTMQDFTLGQLSQVEPGKLVFNCNGKSRTFPKELNIETQSRNTFLYPFPFPNEKVREELVDAVISHRISRDFAPTVDAEYVGPELKRGTALQAGKSYKVLCIQNGDQSIIGDDSWCKNQVITIPENAYQTGLIVRYIQNDQPNNFSLDKRHFVFLAMPKPQ